MRIRKHAKISPLLYASSSTVIHTHVCQLNQSPWDVMTFPPPDPSTLPPPPAFLVDKDHSLLANGFFSDYIAADESHGDKLKWDDDIAAGEGFDNRVARLKKEEDDSIFCCKIDGKGLQCKKKAKNGQSLCDQHHLAQTFVKKSESRRRARPKKPASSSNPYEFYYYSGFGPRWGKKRGGAGLGSASASAIKEEPYTTSHDSSSDTSAKTNNNNNNNNNNNSNSSSIIEVDAEGPNTPEPSVKSSLFTSQFDKEVLDYVEDDDDYEDDYDYNNYDDDDDENGEMGRKRGRKPIKARSLKSLM